VDIACGASHHHYNQGGDETPEAAGYISRSITISHTVKRVSGIH